MPADQHTPGAARASHRLSIIVPVLDEAAGLTTALAPLQRLRAEAGVEVIVADGGSRDGTVALATPLADRVVVAPRGRGSQMNAGAAAASGSVLLFLHADTRLPENAVTAVLDAVADGAAWGRFDVTIEGRLAGLAMVATMMNLRSRLTGIATGDQAIFVTRAAFAEAGGFPDIPLMEDIAFSTRLKRFAPPACLHQRVVTSGRRWEKHGLWQTIFAMWRLRLAFFFGADPRTLARAYGYVPREENAPSPNPIPHVAIAILAKAPIPGLAKTRLIPALGAEGAATLQGRLLERAVDVALDAAQQAKLGPVTLWCAPDCTHPAFTAQAERPGLGLAAQPTGDLGERMLAAVRATPRDSKGTLVIGTDCPALTIEHLHAAASALADHDAVLIPAEDGGYVLIGLRQAIPELFTDMPWGSVEVAAETRARLTRLGLFWRELDPLWDVDRPEDIVRLQALGFAS
jgi:rSAM/selenodomain-associated transferase 2/rSAM/selenodomain-associated transferase 1